MHILCQALSLPWSWLCKRCHMRRWTGVSAVQTRLQLAMHEIIHIHTQHLEHHLLTEMRLHWRTQVSTQDTPRHFDLHRDARSCQHESSKVHHGSSKGQNWNWLYLLMKLLWNFLNIYEKIYEKFYEALFESLMLSSTQHLRFWPVQTCRAPCSASLKQKHRLARALGETEDERKLRKPQRAVETMELSSCSLCSSLSLSNLSLNLKLSAFSFSFKLLLSLSLEFVAGSIYRCNDLCVRRSTCQFSALSTSVRNTGKMQMGNGVALCAHQRQRPERSEGPCANFTLQNVNMNENVTEKLVEKSWTCQVEKSIGTSFCHFCFTLSTGLKILGIPLDTKCIGYFPNSAML